MAPILSSVRFVTQGRMHWGRNEIIPGLRWQSPWLLRLEREFLEAIERRLSLRIRKADARPWDHRRGQAEQPLPMVNGRVMLNARSRSLQLAFLIPILDAYHDPKLAIRALHYLYCLVVARKHGVHVFELSQGSRSPSEARINELGEGLSSYMTILSGG